MSTTFPPQPNENQDPWYTTFTNWANRIESSINQRMELSNGILNETHDLNLLYNFKDSGPWAVTVGNIPKNMPPNWAQSGVVLIFPGSENAAVLQMVVSNTRFTYREAIQASTGSWGNWREALFDDNIPYTHPSAAILRLAKLDGWLSVYDPTNEFTVTRNSATGNIRQIADGLGNLPPAMAGTNAISVPGAFGSLDGFRDYSLLITPTSDLPQPITYMGLASLDVSYKNESRVLIGGDVGPKQHRVFLWPDTSHFTMGDNINMTASGKVVTDRPFCYSASFDGYESTSSINGHFGMTTASQFEGTPVGSIRLGARSLNNPSKLDGNMGPTLIYQGKLSSEKLSRMQRLLMSMSGIVPDPVPAYSGARIYSMDSKGNDTFVYGDPDAISLNGIMSMTKAINAIASRRYLTTNSLLDKTITLVEEDFNRTYSTPLKVGDVISYRDILHLMAIPSDNSAPVAMARHIAMDYIPGTKSPRQRYVDVMNDVLVNDLGFKDASVFYEGGTSLLSPRQVAKMFKLLNEDSVLRAIFGKLTYVVSVTGADPRSFSIASTLDNQRYPILGYVSGKSGTGSSKRHGVALWKAPDGQEHITVVMDVDESNGQGVDRYSHIRIARDAILAGLKVDERDMPKSSGSDVRTTYVRDVSAWFGSAENVAFLQRVNTTVSTTFDDVPMTTNVYSTLYPSGFRPALPYAYGSVTDSSGNTYRCKVSRASGTLTFIDSVVGKTIQGTIDWDVSASASWPLPPYPGEYHTT